MEGREENLEDKEGEDEFERTDNGDERRFKVGELVEFWDGPVVRGYRTDSGAPAWVKADYGLGEYGIKMVGNTRGKLRRVQWKQLFKDGSFNKLQMRVGGLRERGIERMRVIEEGKAEAKFAGKVKEKERELKKAEKTRSEMQEQNDSCHRMQEMKARQSEKDLSAGHKRRLLEMGADQEKTMKLHFKAKDELVREYRVKTRELERRLEVMEEDLCESKAEKEEQERKVKRGKQRLEDLREYGDGWKQKYTDQVEIKEQKMEEELIELGREVKDKVKGKQQMEKKITLLTVRVESLEKQLQEKEKELEDLVEERREVCIP
jgi:chromosome segregation ATPase